MANISTFKRLGGSDMNPDTRLYWLVNDYCNELDEEGISYDKNKTIWEDEEILPMFLDWLCSIADLREEYELVSLIEKESGYHYIVEDGGNQAFI